jgi:hypothetical protein
MMENENDPRIADAMKFLRLSNDADTSNRSEALEDLKFAAGDQWPTEIQNSRNLEARPCLTINKIDPYIRQVTNQQRQARPRIKVHGMNTSSDEKLAEILTGVIRHIEVNSDADQAYDTAFDYSVRMGWGYFRVVTDYIRDDSFDQEIYIRPIDNPFTVYFDPNSILPDGSDAERCLITTVLEKKVFQDMYPDADLGSFTYRGTGDDSAEWIMKDDIRIAEYFYTERKAVKLVQLSDGTAVFEDELPAEEILRMAGITRVGERESMRKQIKWCKLTAMEVLEERTWPGKYIPIVPVYGQQLVIESKRKKYGLVRNAKDPQRMLNFWQTSITESVALAPKAKWLLAEGQDEGHELEWASANIKSTPVLRYKQKDIEGQPAPAPVRLQPEPPPAGILAASASINNDLQAVLGIFDPNQMPTGNLSGKAINGQQQQMDLTNFHYFDNLTRSIRFAGKILLDLIPKIYDHERVMRIIGYDNQPELVVLNQRTVDAAGVTKILNDVTVGEYDVVMETGPGYNSKRQEAVANMMPLLSASPDLMKIAGDLVFRNMDFPGADVIADRLAASNPLANIDEKSDIPPQAQMQIAQSKQMIEQMQQQMQQMELMLKSRADVVALQQDGETKRKLMDVTSRAHNTETINEAKVNQSIMNSMVSQNKAELDAMTKLMLARMDTNQLQAEIAKRDAETQQMYGFSEGEIHTETSPFIQR